MHRFYIPSPDTQEKILEITDSRIVFQMLKVLRMKAGSKFSFFDGNGKEFAVEVLEVGKRKILANVIEPILREVESEIEVSLYQAIPKKTALFELVVQKAVEIGASHIYPLITQRTEKHRLSKFERLQTIAIEATEQCRGLKIPEIHHPVTFEETVKKHPGAYIAFEYEAKKTLDDYYEEIKKNGNAHLMIGPEGGFDQKEIDFALKNKAKPFSLGSRILRTETAAISALSLILLRR